MKTPRKFGLLERLKRIARYRLKVPMLRNTQPAEYVARGVMVGTAWAMTPFFGLHMAAVFITWVMCRQLLKWDFSLVNGLAWTWTTNVLTIIPSFYVFYLTGQVLMGEFSDPLGYKSFHSVFLAAGEGGADDPATLGVRLLELWNAFGVPLFLGSALWTVACGWLAYKLSLGFVIRYREHRARKMARAKRAQGDGDGMTTPPHKRKRRKMPGNNQPLTAVSRRT